MHLFEDFLRRTKFATLGVINARANPALQGLGARLVWLVQPFKPLAAELEALGFKVLTDLLQGACEVEAIFIALPKNMQEAQYEISRALNLLEPGGVLAVSAANNAGGKRAAKILQQFGVLDIQSVSKKHARLAWGFVRKTSLSALPFPPPPNPPPGGGREPHCDSSPRRGEGWEGVQNKENLWSMPGLFSWEKTDVGSALLLQHLPDLKGAGADFCCGWGALAVSVVQKNPMIDYLCCIDADMRAVECCAKNMEGNSNVNIDFLWEDLTQNQDKLRRRFDWIIMNPPFHEGKEAQPALGAACIQTAAASLKPGGALYMVANAHLPYEGVLQRHFKTVEIRAQESGFKVIWAKQAMGTQ